MQVVPLLGFYLRRGSEIEALLDKGTSSDSHLILDLLDAGMPLLKKYYPDLNEKGLLDDIATTLKEVLAPPVQAKVSQSEASSAASAGG
jgi:hypothetical protein